jgi:glycosyltransferase involved in cell wall biosynthesis
VESPFARLPAIVHHTGFESSGGATRVARLIMDGLAEHGVATRLTCELAEEGEAALVVPGAFGAGLAPGELAHLHCSGDWPGLLGSIDEGRGAVITLHDCELFTGGCPYPLECEHLEDGCADPCPRAFPDSIETRKLKHRLLTRLDPLVAAPSRWLARLAKKHLHRPVAIIPNGIPWPERPRIKQEARRQLGILPAARVAVFAAHGGTAAAYKSGGDWRSIWQGVKARVPEALGFAVGGDTAGREGDLVIWPYVERERLALLLASADVLLYPTRADNHSLIILEAMAQGLAVVAYDVGGVPEQVAHGETGVLVTPCRSGEFVDAASALLADPGRCRDMGREAFSSGQRRFDVARMVADYAKLYAQQAGSGPAAE